MKKIFSILLALTVVASAVRANVADPKASVGTAVIKSGSVFKLFYKSELRGDVRVKIVDAKGHEVYSETIKSVASFVRPYNFASLAEGEYTIELSGQDGKQYQHVTHRNVSIAPKAATILHVTGSKNRFMLVVPNKSGADILKIRIFDGNSTLVYSEEQKIESDFAKIYNLDKVGRDFTIELTDGSGSTQLLSYK